MKQRVYKITKIIYIIATISLYMGNIDKKKYDDVNHKLKNEIKLNEILNDSNFIQRLSKVQITVVAPASTVEKDKLEYLSNQKILDLNLPKNFLTPQTIPYHSDSDEERFEQLKEALNNNSKIIWSLRGGYGSARLFENLKNLKKPTHKKIFIGYSDLTFLHLFLMQNWNWKTIHGATLSDLLSPDKDPKNFSLLLDIISKNIDEIKYNDILSYNSLAESSHELNGILVGGNLEMLATSLGTPWQIKGNNKIIFIEDTGSKGYMIDRNLNHLLQANVFKNATAIIFGSFLNGDENVEFALKRFAKEVKIPVFKTNLFGHGYKNYPFILNSNTKISSQEKSITMYFGDEFRSILKPKKNDLFAIR